MLKEIGEAAASLFRRIIYNDISNIPEVRRLQEENQGLKARCETQEAEKARLQADYKGLAATCEREKRDLVLSDIINSLVCNAVYKAKERECRELGLRAGQLEEELVTMNAHFDASSQAFKEAASDNAILRQAFKQIYTENAALRQAIPRAVNLVKRAREAYSNVRTAKDAMIARAEGNAGANANFISIEGVYQKRIKSLEEDLRETRKSKRQLEQNVAAMQGAAFYAGVVQSVVGKNNVPFGYYSFANNELFLNEPARHLLGVESEPDEISIPDLLKYVDRDSRRGIIDALKNKDRLRKYKLSVNGVPLMLSTNTFRYRRSIVGTALLLYSPEEHAILSPYRALVSSASRAVKRVGKFIRRSLDDLARERGLGYSPSP